MRLPLARLAVLVPMLLLLALGAGVEAVREDHDRRLRDQTLLALAESTLHEMQFAGTEAAEPGTNLPEWRKVIETAGAATQRSLQDVNGDAVHVVQARERLAELLPQARRQLDLIAEGRRRQAEQLDLTVVDPGLAAVDDVLREARIDADAAAARSGDRAQTAILALLLLGSLLVMTTVLAVRLITQRVAVARGERRYRAIVEQSGDVFVVLARDGTLQSSSGPVDEVVGVPPAVLDGMRLADIIAEADRDRAEGMLAEVATSGRSETAEWRLLHAGGGVRDVEVTAVDLLDDPAVEGLVLTLRDIAQRKAFEEQLKHRAFHDPLTHLPNRALFLDRVEHAISRDRDNSQISVLFVDLDEFKVVNDRLGHAVGDAVLVETASRLRALVRSGDTVARLGGDEFAILLEGIGTGTAAEQIAERIVQRFAEPADIHGNVVSVNLSVGLACSTPIDAGPDDVLGRADTAMYAAKASGKNCVCIFDESLTARETVIRQGTEATGWLRRAEEQRAEIAAVLDDPAAIGIALQPIVDLQSGLTVGFEALARFPGDRPPNAWFAQAHRCGLGARLEAAAVRAALSVEGRPAGTYLSVNISPSALLSDEGASTLPARLDGILVEVTEHELIAAGSALTTALDELRARGARIAADDAGAGYTGLRQLTELRPDVLKLDRGLVDGVAGDRTKAALIESFVRFARQIGATVCAEGIETLDDLRALADLDVSYGQGYGLARPGRDWPAVAPAALAAIRAGHAAALLAGDDAATSDEAWLAGVATRLARAHTPDALGAIVSSIAKALDADALYFSRLTGDLIETIDTASWQPTGETFALADFPLTREIIERRSAAQVIVTDPHADPNEVAYLHAEGMGAVLLLPVAAHGVDLGLLEVYAREPRPWTRRQLARARLISTHLASALEAIARQGDERDAHAVAEAIV